ncbi:hypothetical protein G5Y08_003654 [Vibrio parahaemolyticus]|uniref:hypothetical protein n=1 Tax=Vibrio parahaemolyticus TaxID=670 RepID=UPI00111F9F89|nr:hypothetical protein [Vibrio parahaemolyticus]EGQ8037372.1 hypothetical protein [Vibrio parahaemolyticus]EHD2278704.1 hypothetical protein [Vibrio parahaemolyticus]EHH2497995.1 hypothetical protein [Vibrio parahaemolyticus]EHR0874473.1 hypothetical protein [Vibrio parahaemolyticus]EID4326785.1 hypothetical protein [Vibrio parahaemolyticus]
MVDTVSKIKAELNHNAFIDKTFPMLTGWGVKDEDVLVHSLGCSVWNTLGHQLGFMAVVEAPAPPGAGNDIRSDSVWFSYATQLPEVVIEFERYDGSKPDKTKLTSKLMNLLEAYHRWDRKPSLLILSFWSKEVVSAPDIRELNQLAKYGAANSKGVFIPGIEDAQLLINRFFFEDTVSQKLFLQSVSFLEAQ